MKKAAPIIRRITLAPILAGVMLIVFRICRAEVFQSGIQFFYTFFFLAIFPVLAYPLQKYVPHFCDKGREGQRHLAMIFAFLGYLCECLFNIMGPVSNGPLLISWTYFLSGVILLTLNQAFHIKVSGHAAGAAAVGILPIILGLNGFIPIAAILLVLVYGASIYTKRHTLPQLVGGTLVPILTALVLDLFGI